MPLYDDLAEILASCNEPEKRSRSADGSFLSHPPDGLHVMALRLRFATLPRLALGPPKHPARDEEDERKEAGDQAGPATPPSESLDIVERKLPCATVLHGAEVALLTTGHAPATTLHD